ncbi:MAG: DUF3006 domain-containing protein [Bacillota bacterium]
MKGYLERIEENKFAVILVDAINKEFIVPKEQLPEGSTENSYFDLTIENDKISSIKLNSQKTYSEKHKVEDLMGKLRANSNGSKFKKK